MDRWTSRRDLRNISAYPFEYSFLMSAGRRSAHLPAFLMAQSDGLILPTRIAPRGVPPNSFKVAERFLSSSALGLMLL